MDFFQAQDRARRRTGLLVVLFGCAMVALAVGLYLVVLVAIGTQAPGALPPEGHLVLFVVVAGATWATIGLASLFRTAQLRQGGSRVASLLGGRPVSPDTTDAAERRLVNVVEEMSIASGTPVPAIFVLDDESSINAFAAGYSIHDAAVAVTRGTLETLNRDELQGVIAHEFSHILNGDMRLNVRLMGLLFGILFLTIIGRGILRGGVYSRRSRGSGQTMLIGLALVVLGFLGLFFGRLIKAAVSRQREFLADAAAVEFTRNPGGIGGALRKIADHSEGARIRNHHAEEASHLFFAEGLGSAFGRAMATHPPLDERIRRVDPSGIVLRPGVGGDPAEAPTPPRPAAGRAASATPAPGAPSPDRMAGMVLGAAVLMGSVGAPDPTHVAYARRLLERIPDPLRAAAHDPQGAQALVLALLAGEGDEATLEAVRAVATELDLAAVDRMIPPLRELGPEVRLPLLDLALPALRGLTPEAAAAFRGAVQRVIRSDGELRPFDLALVHILWRHLPGGSGGDEGRRRTVSSLRSVSGALEALLSAVARSGADDEEAARAAFEAGRDAMSDPVAGSLALRPAAAARLSELDDSLAHLERGTLEVRRRVLEACAAAALADREVRTAELELLRAVAESLELPLPPVIPPEAATGEEGGPRADPAAPEHLEG